MSVSPLQQASTFAPRVYLVGAGPGDPELLTLKAARVLQQASLVLMDDLVNPAVLEHVPPAARIIHVGKRGGCQSTPQAFIEKLMVTAALEGERVVRLKGGDPFIFGRGGEEVEALLRAGLQVEVVNGITAGLAAVTSMNVPLTHRRHAQGVVFMTGHTKPNAPVTDWATLARTAHTLHLTLVVYMGLAALPHITQGLLQGLPPGTPAAVVHQVSLPQQRQLVGTLGSLAAQLAQNPLPSPAVVVVGNVLHGLTTLVQRHPNHESAPEPAQAA